MNSSKKEEVSSQCHLNREHRDCDYETWHKIVFEKDVSKQIVVSWVDSLDCKIEK